MRRTFAFTLALLATACGNDKETVAILGTSTGSDAANLPDGTLIQADGTARLPDGNVVQKDGAPLEATPTSDGGAITGDASTSDGTPPPADAQPGDTTTPPPDTVTPPPDTVTPPPDTVTPPPDVPPLSDTKTADGSAAKYTNCTGVLTCAGLACSKPYKPGCDAVCVDGASQTAAALYLPYANCLAKAIPACQSGKCAPVPGQPPPSAKCVEDCGNEKCGFLIVPCMNDGKSGDKPCSSLFPCQTACKQKGVNEFQCVLDCYAAMSPVGQQQMQAFFDCAAKKAETSKVDDPFAACPGELLTCLGDGKVGTASCGVTFECFLQCAQKGGGESAVIGCLSECYPKATAPAQKRFAEAMSCMGKDGKSPPAQCGGIVPLVKCFGSGTSGTAPCVALADCLSGCNFATPQGWACAGKCWDGASPPAQAAFSDAATCGEDATPKCQAGVLTCANPQGSKNCLDVAQCVGQCKDNIGCVIGCVKQGSASEAKKAIDLLACSAQKGCESKCIGKGESCNLDCVKTQCKAQFDACLAK